MKIQILGNLFSCEIKNNGGNNFGEVVITESVRNTDPNAEKKYERIYWTGRCSENRAKFVSQYFPKGKAIYAEGTCTRRVVKQDDGTYKEWHNIWLDNFNFVPNDFREEGQEPQGQAPQGQAPMGQAPQGQAPQGQAPMGQAPQGQAPSPFDAAPQGGGQNGDSPF